MSSDMQGYPARPGRCVAYVYMNTAQTTNLATGDHIKFDTIGIAPTDNRITVDVTSAYSTAVGPSLGRFSLLPGYIYEIEFNLAYTVFSSSSADISAGFYDNITGSFISPSNWGLPVSATNNVAASSSVKFLYAPTSNNLIEVRFRDNTNVSQIGLNSGADVLLPTLIIKSL